MLLSSKELLLSLSLLHFGTECRSLPVVTIPDGSIQATVMESHHGLEFYGFQSIPYALPPVASLRWIPPHPHQGWNGTLDGAASPVLCVQSVPDTDTKVQNTPEFIIGQEDCLILNVYSPNLEASSPLPVMVWFHGGGLASGEAGLYGPHFFMDYQVVVVTVNYRLGPWGFLSLDTPTISGNQGLRDQVLALEWVKDNIKFFGGDGDQVTIFGESAGSWSVFHHILSPPSSSLFRAAIGQSGTMISGLADTSFSREDAARNGRNFASTLGCYQEGDSWDGDQVELCAREKTTEQLFSAYTAGTFRSRGSVDSFSSHPPILPDFPDILLGLGLFNKVPVIIGSNSGEGILNSGKYIKDPSLMDIDFEDPDRWDNEQGPFYIFDRIPGLNKTDSGSCDVTTAKAAREFYFNGTINSEKLKQFINLNTDVQFWYGSDKMIKYLSPFVPVFHYILTFQDLKSFSANFHVIGTDLGVCHADDLAYLWDYFGINAATGLYDFWWNEDNQRNSRRMLEMWTNFAKYLDPTPGGGSIDLEGVTWEPITEEGHKFLNIDTNLTMDMSKEYLQRMEFWNSVQDMCKN